MKTKPCIFMFFLCELIIIFVVAIKSFIDEKQFGATKEYKTKIEVDMDKYWGRNGGGGYWGGEHDDVDMGGWLGRGTPRRRGEGGSEGGNKGGSGGSENKGPGGGPGGEGQGETKGPGGEGGGGGNKGGSEGSENKGSGGGGGLGGEGRGETKGPEGEGGGIKNGDHVEHP